MKQLIMFVLVFAISTFSLGDDLNPPDWAGAPGTIYGIWGFDEEAPSGYIGDREDYPEEGAMVPHDSHPDPAEFEFTSDTEGAHRYMFQGYTEQCTWLETYQGREGVLSASVGWDFEMYNFEGSGTKLIRLQITSWPGGGEIDEFWIDQSNGDEVGPIDPDDLLVAEIADVGDGWTHRTYEYEIVDNPFWEGIWIGVAGEVAIDQIVIDTICYPGDELPVGPGRGDFKPPLTVDFNDVPVYEPVDPDGPPLLGPTEGELLVSLAMQPGGDIGYPAFTANVTVDPNPNEGTPHEDFIFPDSVAGDGSVELTFTETDWAIPQSVSVEALQDLDKEGYQDYRINFTVTIDIADPNFGNPTPVVVQKSVGVVDNDIPFIMALPSGPLENVLTENEPGVPTCIDIRPSHLPTDDVYVLVNRYSDYDVLLESMSVMDPPLGVTDDPNKLKFTPDNYSIPQQICLEARDDDVLAEAWLEWVEGEIYLTPYSKDLRYLVSWLNPDGSEVPVGEVSGGEGEEVIIDFNVQDNECGSVGYPSYDINQDCAVDLGEVAILCSQWLLCTDPYASSSGGGSSGIDCDTAWSLVEQ